MNRPGESKPPLSYVLTYADEEALTWDHGATVHSRDGWRSEEIDAQEFLDALLRHAARINAGELIDPKSKLPHAAHIAVNAKIYGVKTRGQVDAQRALAEQIQQAPRIANESEQPYQPRELTDTPYELRDVLGGGS